MTGRAVTAGAVPGGAVTGRAAGATGRRWRRVLVARCDNAGDVLLSGPAVRALAGGCDHLTYLCGPNGEQAARMLPAVDDVIVERLPWIDPCPERWRQPDVLRLAARLRETTADLAIVLTSFHQSPLPLALVLRMAGVPTVAAISTDYPGSLLDVRHLVPDDLHEVERSLSLAARVGCELPAADDGRLAVRLPVAPSSEVLAEWGISHERFVVVHPGASVPARAWSAAHHASLVDALLEDGRPVVVTGSRSERALTRSVVARHAGDARVVDLGGRTDLAELAVVLAAASAVVVGNTGPAHLAAAVGTPVVSLFAPTVDPARWRPWRVPSVVLGRQDIECAGCRARVCPVAGHPCLSAVTPRQVVDALRWLGEGRRAAGGTAPAGGTAAAGGTATENGRAPAVGVVPDRVAV